MLNLGLSGYLAQLYGYLTIVQGMGPVQGGLALAPLFLAAVLLARPAARVTIRTGGTAAHRGRAGPDERRVALHGRARQSHHAVLAAHRPDGRVRLAFLVAQTAWNDAFLRVIPPNLIGASAGTSKAAAQAGTWLGTALLATNPPALRPGRLCAAAHRLRTVRRPDHAGDQRGRCGVARRRTDGTPDRSGLVTLGLLNAYYASYTVGFTTALLWAAGICVAMAAGVWIVFRTPVSGGRRSPGQRVAQPSPTDAPAPRPDPAARSSTDPDRCRRGRGAAVIRTEGAGCRGELRPAALAQPTSKA